MKWRQTHVLSVVTAASCLIVSCSGEPASGQSIETIASAIRAVGYPCAKVIDSNELGDDRAGWRVACEGTFTYTASVSKDGSICITPLLYEDSIGPALAQAIDEECISAGDI